MTLLAATVAQALKARRHSGGWIAHCPAHNDRDPSLTIRDGRNGILLHCWAGCSFQSILDAIKALGVTDDPSSAPTLPPHRREATGGRIGSIEAALRIWDQAGALCEVSRLYLERRGLLTAKGVRSLRSTRLRHPETKEENVPTLIVPRHDDKGHVVGVQRIFLDEAKGTKYQGGLAKMSLGEQGVARLSAPSGGLIGLAEGPETALAASLMSGMSVWACCGGFPQAKVNWPVKKVLLFVDNDSHGNSKTKAIAFEAANRGLEIKFWMPKNVGEDAADVWSRKMIEAAVDAAASEPFRESMIEVMSTTESDRAQVQIPEIIAQFRNEVMSKEEFSGEPSKKTPIDGALTRYTADQLEDKVFPPIKYIVPGYLPEGLTILAGKPKLGKSWMCMDFSVSVAFGGTALGTIGVEQGDVLYAALEDGARRFQKRMRNVLRSPGWPRNMHVWHDMKRLDEGGIKEIETWIDSVDNPRLVIIDTLAKVKGERNSKDTTYEGDYKAMGALHALARDRGIGIVLVHHTRKMEAEDPIDAVSGTLGLTGAVDTIMVLNKTGGNVTLYARGRDIEEIEAAVVFDADTCRWRITGGAGEQRYGDGRSEVLGLLRSSGELTPKDIAETLSLDGAHVRKILQRLVESGKAQIAGRGRYLPA